MNTCKYGSISMSNKVVTIKTKMFKKLLSNLPYNPSLIGQVSFYANRLHAEEKIRRLGLVFVVMAFLVQMFAFVNQPEPTLASSSNDIIPGGFTTRDQAVLYCLDGNKDITKIFAYYGLTCDIIANATTETIRSTDQNKQYDSLGRNPQGPVIARTGKPTNEYAVNIPNVGRLYMRNLWAWDSGAYSTYKVLRMTNKHGQVIRIMYNCGNIVTVGVYQPPAPPAAPNPTPPKDPPYQTPPAVPTPGSAACASLVPTALDERTYRFKAQATGKDYTVKSYVFVFGDGTSKTVTTSAKSATAEHTYRATRTYNASVKINVSVQGTSGQVAQTVQCQTTVATNTPDACPNVVGTQASKSECDVCPNIPGTQNTEAECKPCEASESSDDALVCLVLSKVARNVTQKIDNADGTMANGGDTITYTLLTTNNGKTTIRDYVIEENIADVLDYADVTNLNGGKIEGVLVRWPATTLSPGETVRKRLSVKVKNPIPSTPVSVSDASRFDLIMNNVYGNAVNIKLQPNIVKTTELTTQRLPNTGPGETVAAVFAFTVFVSYFYARTRLLAKEMDIVRTDYATTGGY